MRIVTILGILHSINHDFFAYSALTQDYLYLPSAVKKTVRELQSQRRSDERHLPGGCVDIKKYEDAVVMPWYRDMDQRHFFYVAELCTILNPRR